MAKKIRTKKVVSKKKETKKPKYVCESCGLVVSVDQSCGCVETCDIICCGKQMAQKS